MKRGIVTGALAMVALMQPTAAKVRAHAHVTLAESPVSADLHGAEDRLVPVDASRDVAACITGAELRVIPSMGHNLAVSSYPSSHAILSAATRARQTTRAGSPR